MGYEKNMIRKILEEGKPEGHYKIKVMSGDGEVSTNWMGITKHQLQKIQKVV